MIGDGSEAIRSLTLMIGKTVIKLVWIFPQLDFFSKFKPVSTYQLTVFHMENRFSSRKSLLINEVVSQTFSFCFLFTDINFRCMFVTWVMTKSGVDQSELINVVAQIDQVTIWECFNNIDISLNKIERCWETHILFLLLFIINIILFLVLLL